MPMIQRTPTDYHMELRHADSELLPYPGNLQPGPRVVEAELVHEAEYLGHCREHLVAPLVLYAHVLPQKRLLDGPFGRHGENPPWRVVVSHRVLEYSVGIGLLGRKYLNSSHN